MSIAWTQFECRSILRTLETHWNSRTKLATSFGITIEPNIEFPCFVLTLAETVRIMFLIEMLRYIDAKMIEYARLLFKFIKVLLGESSSFRFSWLIQGRRHIFRRRHRRFFHHFMNLGWSFRWFHRFTCVRRACRRFSRCVQTPFRRSWGSIRWRSWRTTFEEKDESSDNQC